MTYSIVSKTLPSGNVPVVQPDTGFKLTSFAAIGKSSKVDKPKSVAAARSPRKPGKGEA